MLQLGTNPHYMTVRAVGHSLTGLTSLVSTPYNWHPHWFYNQDEHLIDDTNHHLLTRTSDNGTSNNFTSEKTQRFTPLFNEGDTSNVFLLTFTNLDLKLSTLDGFTSRNTGCTPPSNQILRRHYSFLYREIFTNYNRSIS